MYIELDWMPRGKSNELMPLSLSHLIRTIRPPPINPHNSSLSAWEALYMYSEVQ